MDEILWNGEVLDESELVRNLNLTREMATEPELQFEPEGTASYELSARVLNVIKASGVSKFGFVGNERYRTFGAEGTVTQ